MFFKKLFMIGLSLTILSCDNVSKNEVKIDAPQSQEDYSGPVEVNIIASGKMAKDPAFNAIVDPSGLTITLADTQASQENGVHFTISSPEEDKLSGKNAQIRIRARSISEDLIKFRANYYTLELGNSGWWDFEATSISQDFIIEYKIPTMVKGKGDSLRILPILYNKSQGLVVEEIEVLGTDKP